MRSGVWVGVGVLNWYILLSFDSVAGKINSRAVNSGATSIFISKIYFFLVLDMEFTGDRRFPFSVSISFSV